jgi:hypothetical protein
MALVSPTIRRAHSSTRSPFGREADEARAAIDQQYAEHVFQGLDPARQRRLADAARFGGASEVRLAGKRDNEFEPVDHESPDVRGSAAAVRLDAYKYRRARARAIESKRLDMRIGQLEFPITTGAHAFSGVTSWNRL